MTKPERLLEYDVSIFFYKSVYYITVIFVIEESILFIPSHLTGGCKTLTRLSHNQEFNTVKSR